MAARWATSAPTATWITPSPSSHLCSAAMSTATRPAPASSPTACRRPSTKRCWPRARPWCAHSSSPRRACDAAPAADRQLRFLHLQPGAGVPGPGSRGERLAQRRAHPAGGVLARTLAPVHLARSRDAVRCGRVHGHDPRLRRPYPGAGCLPRTPGHRGSVRWQGRAGRSAHARQDLAHPSRSAHAVRGSAAAVRGGALPFIDRRSREAARAARGECADRGSGDHGGAPPHAGGGGRAVSSREHPHARGSTAAGQFPRVHRRRARRAGHARSRPWRSRVSCCNSSSSAATCRRATGFTFLFSPHSHPATRAIAPIRAALGVRTVFNIVGPLVNPAQPPLHLVGAFSVEVARLIADTFQGLPMERAFVVHGALGWDEPTPAGPFTLFDVRPGRVEMQVRAPSQYGLAPCSASDLAGGDAGHNARALAAVLYGEDRGAHRDCLLLGTALALELAGETRAPREGLARAAAASDSGAARRLLEALKARRPDGERNP